MNEQSLDSLAGQKGCGKVGHDYLRFYEQYFSPLRKRPIILLEIGIEEGCSLAMWAEWFASASIYGVDSRQHSVSKALDLGLKNVCPVLCDQGDTETLVAKLGHIKFDVIIDDGSHKSDDQIGCVAALWTCLKPGGLYFIEDLLTNYPPYYNKYFGGAPRQTCVDWLKSLLDDLNYHGRFNGSKLAPEERASLNDWERTLEFIHFYPYLAVLGKRSD
jgi:hypothetical protein